MLLVSAMAHATMLVPARLPALTAEPTLGSVSLNVELAAIEPSEPSSFRTGAAEHLKRPQPADAITGPNGIESDTATSNHVDTDASTEAANQTQSRFLLGELETELSRYLIYPGIARARGWQGTAVLRVTVGPAGVLRDSRLVSSSGYGVLDHASLDGIRRIQTLARATNRTEVVVLLPIRFRLTDNI